MVAVELDEQVDDGDGAAGLSNEGAVAPPALRAVEPGDDGVLGVGNAGGGVLDRHLSHPPLALAEREHGIRRDDEVVGEREADEPRRFA